MIKTQHLTKRYEALTAVDDVSFEVSPGEVLGFLGPNGAGKTTTMRMIAGFITPTAGTCQHLRPRRRRDPLAPRPPSATCPEGAPVYGEMTVRRFLDFIADLRRLDGGAAPRAPRARHRAPAARGRARAEHRDALQGLPAPRRTRAGHHPRSAGADPRRAHRRPRPEPEARGAHAHQRHGARQDHHHLHPHPRGGRRGVHAARSSSSAGASSPTTPRRAWPPARATHNAVSMQLEESGSSPPRAPRSRRCRRWREVEVSERERA